MGVSGSKGVGGHHSLEEFVEAFPLRLPTLLLSEDDPVRIDVDYWLDLFRRTRVGGVTFSAGGYVAYYPTRIPLHHRSRWLGDRDLLGELVRGARRIGLKYVLVRTDPHAVHNEVFDAHPDWIMRDAEGRPKRHWTCADAWVTCALGPYNFEYMTQVHREIFSLYEVDFLFANRWAGHGTCYCEHCRRGFREATGLDLPRCENTRDPVFRAYQEWREGRLFDLIDAWNGALEAVRPGTRFIPNSGGGATSGLDMVRLAERVPFLIVDRQARPPSMAPWANGKNAKEFRATLGRKPALAGVNVGLCGKHRWMDSVKSSAELRLWLAEAVAHGMVPRYTKHSSVVYDSRWVAPVEEFFRWHAEAEPYLRNIEPLAQVGLVYSQQTGRYYGGSDADTKVEGPILGWYQALVEARIPFEMVHDRLLDDERTSRLKTLILPNTAALSDLQCDHIRRHVARGGGLVATFETSLYDEWGERRPDLGLGDLLGARCTGGAEGPLANSYLTIERGPGGYHPLVAGLEDAGRIINGVHRLPVAAAPGVAPQVPLTLVPSYPDLPMEELYPRQARTDVPELIAHEAGGGRVVYFPWDVDRTFWEVLCEDHARLLRNAVVWATRDEPLVTVQGPGMIDLAVWRQARSMTVHLVNLTNPMTMRGPYREILPVGAQAVRLRLAAGVTPRRVHLLRSGSRVEPQIDRGILSVTVPRIEDYEILAIDT